jgi:2-polyprenyl-3-methyl-5-hydroxy-6-metoxy-1,4-benzoquinol methylase
LIENNSKRLNLTCGCCGFSYGEVFYAVERTPVNSCLLIESKKQAVNFPCGSLFMAFCSDCGFIWNAAFDENLIEYSEKYEGTQSYSNTFNEFSLGLAKDLIDKYDLTGKKIIEIGCGKGEFLQMLCVEGNNTGIGFDPAYKDGAIDELNKNRLKFIRENYSEKFSTYKADFVCCKMTLEHIFAPRDFLESVRRAIAGFPDVIVFFQMPNAGKHIEEGAVEDFYYEHCSYFSQAPLAKLFTSCGFKIHSLKSVYDDQYLNIEASLDNSFFSEESYDEDLFSLIQYVARFRSVCEENRHFWDNFLSDANEEGRKVVLWGSGSKAVGFLTSLKNSDMIKYIVDINPNKVGSYTAGTGQEIVSPAMLIDYEPQDVIIMNSIYKKEISETLSSLNINSNVHTLR